MINEKEYVDLLVEIEDISTYPQTEPEVKLAYIQRIIAKFKKKHSEIVAPTIKEIVANAYKIPADSLNILTRSDLIKETRQIAMWYYFHYSLLSFGRIGEQFSNGQHVYAHCTVLHSVRKIDELRQVDKRLLLDMDLITKNIEIYYLKVNRIIKKQQNDRHQNVSCTSGKITGSSTPSRQQNVQGHQSRSVDRSYP